MIWQCLESYCSSLCSLFCRFLGRELCDNLSPVLQKPGFSWAAEGSAEERLCLGCRCTWSLLHLMDSSRSEGWSLWFSASSLWLIFGYWEASLKQGILPQLSHGEFTNLLDFLFGFDGKWVPLLPSIQWSERRQLPQLQPMSSKRSQTLLWRSVHWVLHQFQLNYSWQPRSREVLHLFVLPRHLIS